MALLLLFFIYAFVLILLYIMLPFSAFVAVCVLFLVYKYWIKPFIRRHAISQYTTDTTGYMNYSVLPDRKALHALLNDRTVVAYPRNTVYTCKREDGRIVGASVIFDSEQLRMNKKLIRDGHIKRNDYLRKQVNVPGRDAVRSIYSTTNNGTKMFHYHSTHMIPFRLCLTEGADYDVMITGTAALNSGSRPTHKWFIDNQSVTNRVNYIRKKIKYRPRYFMEHCYVPKKLDNQYAPEHNMFSLDDFERVIDATVYDKNTPYHATWKYSVECFYTGRSPIPSHVEIDFYCLSQNKRIFKAKLDNLI